MSEQFQLRVVTPRRLVLAELVREVSAPGTVGEFGVLADHITFLSSIETGPLSYRTDRGRGILAIRSGFVEVTDNVMTVLADAAEVAAEIDTARAQRDLQDAANRLEALSPIDPQYAAAEADRLWAQTRLDLAPKK